MQNVQLRASSHVHNIRYPMTELITVNRDFTGPVSVMVPPASPTFRGGHNDEIVVWLNRVAAITGKEQMFEDPITWTYALEVTAVVTVPGGTLRATAAPPIVICGITTANSSSTSTCTSPAGHSSMYAPVTEPAMERMSTAPYDDGIDRKRGRGYRVVPHEDNLLAPSPALLAIVVGEHIPCAETISYY